MTIKQWQFRLGNPCGQNNLCCLQSACDGIFNGIKEFLFTNGIKHEKNKASGVEGGIDVVILNTMLC